VSQPGPAQNATHPAVAAALRDCRRAFWSVAVFSGAVNLLMLAGPIYMLQVYDRVLASRSVPTLIALSAFMVGAYGFQAIFDMIRSRVVVRAASLLDRQLATTVHGAVIKLGVLSRSPGEAQQPVRDLDQIRAFLTSPGPTAIVDLPWMPAFLAICYIIHPWLGWLSLAGALVLLGITILTERASRQPSRELSREGGLRSAMIEADRRNSETVVAMGMAGALATRWNAVNDRFIGATQISSDVVGSYSSITRVVRLLLQSAVLGLGAYLVIKNELTAGGMIAASIMMGRALAPIETAIANWRGFISARQSVKRLSELLSRLPRRAAATELPKPVRSLDAEDLVIAAPGAQTAVLQNIRFQLVAGDVLGIIGPSGAGKTSLVRTLVGVWRPMRGTVRLDGAALDQWDSEMLGQHIGFVSQAIDLFDGTIAENIARMASSPDSEAVFRAARAAGAHDMILKLPKGYDTPIGEAGAVLSAGQRQRLALARAFYGDPFFIALDEPHANLDSEGDQALMQAIQTAKERMAIIAIVAHRPSALANCNKVILLRNGTQQAFGPREEVLAKIARPGAQPAATAGLKVVGDTQVRG
jgi:PrtD family type I secretion system ABC transporter